MSAEKYNGRWRLIPELCIYQSGEPPNSGSYEIQTEGGLVQFKIEWTDQSAESHTISFGGPVDGTKLDSDAPGVSAVSYEKINDSSLNSTAFDGDKILLYAQRVVSSDGNLMAVSQVIYSGESSTANFQVYRREGSP